MALEYCFLAGYLGRAVRFWMLRTIKWEARLRAKLFGSLMAAACLTPVMANAAEWRVTITLISGNTTSCSASDGTKFMVLQDGNTLTLTNMTKSTVYMKIPLQPDGSATGEAPIQLTQLNMRNDRVRVKVPPGTDRRRFELLTLREICGLSVDPA